MMDKVGYGLLFFSQHFNFIKRYFFFLLAVYIMDLGYLV